jgi:hypothetical protein
MVFYRGTILTCLAAVVVLACAACEATSSRTPKSVLSLWQGHSREVFDDNIDAAAVGLSMDGPSPMSDPFLRERAQTAEVVLRLRVKTVTVDSIGEKSTFHLELEAEQEPLAGTKLIENKFEVAVAPQSPAYSIARAFDARLRGHAFIGFLRHFAGETAEPELHWHLSADSADIVAAVQAATPH